MEYFKRIIAKIPMVSSWEIIMLQQVNRKINSKKLKSAVR